MDKADVGQLGLYLVFWVIYFLTVYAGCAFAYFKIREKPPKSEKELVRLGGRTITAMEAWDKKDRILQKRFLWIGMGLMAAPLLFPLLSTWFG